MSVYILSKLANDNAYCAYHLPDNYLQGEKGQRMADMPLLKKRVLIKGGAGLTSLTSGFGEMSKTDEGVPMWTADGCITPISDADYELIKDNHVFKEHMEKGLIKVLNKDITGNYAAVKKEVATMNGEDPHAPMNAKRLAEREAQLRQGLKSGDFKVH